VRCSEWNRKATVLFFSLFTAHNNKATPLIFKIRHGDSTGDGVDRWPIDMRGWGWLRFATAVLSAGDARADQGGVSFWLPGINASLAAVPPSPGFSVPSMFYFYTGEADRDRNFAIGI
jgi:hypothetical protein